MTMAEVRVKEWGNSLGIVIPKELVKHVGLHKGDTIKVDIVSSKKIDGFGMFKGIGKYKEEEEPHKEFW
ncbi:MAG: AbrB/MazE/SpoVT family DNA-binding domain-containing protein [Nanoarchaeota archaeon]|nr:AbrB/MazE/SpoVT family DNA-binding domain-containing protein [Nanoarchaeota archaeon]